ncbi:MAG: 50S ribosomal protein L5 [Clostridiales bacterium]|nr:50S ribosomal protein L5 [Clostridiales bacterium]
MTRMKKKYQEEVAPALMKKFSYKSTMEIPKVEKVVISVGAGDCKDNQKALDAVIKDISAIAGQKAVATVARKSVANFKLREGQNVGVKVTLRQDRMWEFLDRLLNVALPRVRDFRGINPDAFDGRGNYSLGLKEQIIFPEIDYDKIEKLRGMNVSITTTAKTDEEARELLSLLGAPFKSIGG